MKNSLVILLSAVLLLTAGAYSQTTINITTNSTDCSAVNSCAKLNITTNNGAALFQLTGTWTGTVTFEATTDGQNWYAINVYPPNSTTAATTATASGAYLAPASSVAGAATVRVRGSAAMTGAVGGVINPSNASARVGGGGGGGSSAFNAITSGTNTTAAMLLGAGGTLDVTLGTTSTPGGSNTANHYYITDWQTDASTVPVVNETVCFAATGGTVILCPANATNSILGIAEQVNANPGYTRIAIRNETELQNFDAATVTAGHWAVSSATPGLAHDVATYPTCGNSLIGFIKVGGSSSVGQILVQPDVLPACSGVGTSPRIVFETPITSIHATQGPVTMQTPAASGRYRFQITASQVDIGTSCSGTSTEVFLLTYTDTDSSQVFSSATVGLVGGSASVVASWTIPTALGATSGFRSFSFTFNAKASTNITYTATYAAGTSCAPGPNVSLYPVLEVLP